MVTDAALIADIMALPKEKKAEVAEHVERLKNEGARNGSEKHPRRRAGSRPDAFVVMPDFDDPLEDLEEYM